MFEQSKILAIIPARAGSKGITDKNIIDVCGKPLISYSIEAAKNSKYIDEVIVSTDGERIAEVSKRYGASVPFLRPKALASDTSKTIDAILYTINTLVIMGKKYDVLVLLQPTSPLRTTKDIDGAIESFFLKSQRPLASVSEVNDHPLLIRTIENNGEMKNLLNESSTCRRQDMPSYYRINGAIYINRIDDLNESTSFNDNRIPFIIKKRHSVDIDQRIDVEVVKYYLNNENNEDD